MRQYLGTIKETAAILTANTVWIAFYYLLYSYYPEWREPLLFGTICCIAYRCGETIVFGIGESWLPNSWGYMEKGVYRPYHFFKFVALIALWLSGWTYDGSTYDLFTSLAPVGIYFALTMNFWYHVNLKYTSHREWKKIFHFYNMREAA